MMSLRGILAAALVLVGIGAQAQAGFIPVGVQNDVAVSTVTGSWGWTQIYRGGYNVDSVSLATALSGASDYLMLGAVNNQTNTIHVLAAALTTDVLTHTQRNVTHVANGAEWYFNGGSMGFAKLGDTISQNQADTNNTNAAQRLSWHTDGGSFIGEYSLAAQNIRFGWRAGEFTGLNNSTQWDKIIFTMSASPVPEPASVAVWGLGAIGLAFARRRRSSLCG